jgi:hypothetical protein
MISKSDLLINGLYRRCKVIVARSVKKELNFSNEEEVEEICSAEFHGILIGISTRWKVNTL